jgi:hypothetical protein
MNTQTAIQPAISLMYIYNKIKIEHNFPCMTTITQIANIKLIKICFNIKNNFDDDMVEDNYCYF